MSNDTYNFVFQGFMKLGAESDEQGVDPSEFFSYVSSILVAIALANGGLAAVHSLTASMAQYGEELHKMNQGKESESDGTRTIH